MSPPETREAAGRSGPDGFRKTDHVPAQRQGWASPDGHTGHGQRNRCAGAGRVTERGRRRQDYPQLLAFSAATAGFTAHLLCVDPDAREFWRMTMPVVGWGVIRRPDCGPVPDVTAEAMVQYDAGSAELTAVTEYARETVNLELVAVLPDGQAPDDADWDRARARLIDQAVRAIGPGS